MYVDKRTDWSVGLIDSWIRKQGLACLGLVVTLWRGEDIREMEICCLLGANRTLNPEGKGPLDIFKIPELQIGKSKFTKHQVSNTELPHT